MPLYEYRCTNDRCQRITLYLETDCNHLERNCEHCGAEAKRIISAPSFRVNGYNADNGYSM